MSRLQEKQEDGKKNFLKTSYFIELDNIISIFSHWRNYLIHFAFPLRAYSAQLIFLIKRILLLFRPLIIDKIGIFNFGRSVSVTLNPVTYA
jgi:hypothetical protein